MQVCPHLSLPVSGNSLILGSEFFVNLALSQLDLLIFSVFTAPPPPKDDVRQCFSARTWQTLVCSSTTNSRLGWEALRWRSGGQNGWTSRVSPGSAPLHSAMLLFWWKRQGLYFGLFLAFLSVIFLRKQTKKDLVWIPLSLSDSLLEASGAGCFCLWQN